MVAVPADRPGLGVEIDVDFIESLTTRVEILERDRVAVAVG
jgi:hypothetical protein